VIKTEYRILITEYLLLKDLIKMKSLLFTLISIVTTTVVLSQQAPLSESYFIDKYYLAPSYAGNFNPKFLFMGYRSDWTGVDGGPKTFRMSYNDIFPFMKNAGYGGKIIYDKAGIFNHIYMMGSYSYNLQVAEGHQVLFGLSMGFYKNRLNLLDYYNDPTYTLDPSLINQDIKSKVKFMTDFSAIWMWQGVEAGITFANIAFGDISYKNIDLKYTPLANYQFHATYNYSINEDFDLLPLAIVRAGKDVKTQVEVAGQVVYLKRFWGSLVYRDPGTFGTGIGASIDKGLKIGYNFNFATNIQMGVYNNHEISIGFNIWEYLGTKGK